jgi:HEAT repeat protein
LGDKEAVKPLIELLKDTKSDVRFRAASALGQLGDTQIVKPLIKLLKDTDSSVRASAASALGQLGDSQAVKPLIELLKDTESYVRSRAADALGNLGDSQAVKPLIELLKDTESSVRSRAMSVLTKFGSNDEKVLAEKLEELKEKSLRHNAYQRQQAAEKLGQLFIEQSVLLLTPLLKKDENFRVKKQAIISLGQIGEWQAKWLVPVLPQLRPLLDEANIHIRRETFIALGKIVPQLSEEKERWFNTFVDIVKNQEEIFAIRAAALKVLAKLGTDKAAKLILEMLPQEIPPNPHLSKAGIILSAFKALGDIGSQKALDFLNEQLEELTERKRAWREERDVDIPNSTQTQEECVASQTFDDKNIWQQSQWEITLSYAITQIDPETSGIKLLSHELAEVRKGAWLAMGLVENINIIKDLVKKRRESEPDQAHFRHAAYRAIDNALVAVESRGNAAYLKELKGLFSEVEHAGIKDRLKWTILTLSTTD